MEFPISQPKVVRLPRNEKQTYRLNSRAQMWPSGLTLAMTLTLNFQGQIWNFLYISAKSGPIATKRKANISIELQASNVTNGMDLPDSDWGDFSCRRAVDSSSFKACRSSGCIYLAHQLIPGENFKTKKFWDYFRLQCAAAASHFNFHLASGQSYPPLNVTICHPR